MENQVVCPRGSSIYIWRRGDTIASVARRNRTTEQSIYLVNEGRDLSALAPGDRICVPPALFACLSGETYTVKAGDTFASIAASFGITTWELAERNPYTDPSRLVAGQVICVPEGGGGTQECPSGYTEGVVQYGESYVDILINNVVSYSAFSEANPGLEPARLAPGQRYCVPPAGSSSGACCIGRRYAVQDGETLLMIAEKFGTTQLDLLQKNPTLTPNDFAAGRVICV